MRNTDTRALKMILDLGRIDYEECYMVQKTFVGKRRLGEIDDSLILAEHNEVFTIGRTGAMDNLLISNETLASIGIKILRVDRGGDVTFHGPGQLVIYPIIDLKNAGKDLHRYLRDLEEAAIRFLDAYSVSGERVYRKTGVWVSGKKIVSIGVGASNWVTFHGMSININCDLNFFSMINPCGMKDVEMTSLELAGGRKIKMADAKKNILKSFKGVFGIHNGEYNYREAVLA